MTLPTVFLNVDAGELSSEPEELWAVAHAVNIACGGHAGDDASMAEALRRCLRHGTAAGAHPSYPDREGFGRTAQHLGADAVRATVNEQCARLALQAAHLGVELLHVKPHGALYHAANADRSLADAVVAGARAALGHGVLVLGPPEGELRAAAERAGLPFAAEAFPDRGVRADGSLVPRGEPGAVLTDPGAVGRRAEELVARGEARTLCIHGDTPGAVALGRVVRGVLERVASEGQASKHPPPERE